MWLKQTMERIQFVVMKKVETYWLEPYSSYLIENLTYSQFDLPICGRAFLFRCFNHMANIPLSNFEESKKFFMFYFKYSKLQQKFGLKRIVAIKNMEEAKIEEFTYYKFTILRGDLKQKSEFIFVADHESS